MKIPFAKSEALANNWQSFTMIIISCNLHLDLLGIIFHLAISILENIFLSCPKDLKVLNKICFPLSSVFVIKLFLLEGRSILE